MKRIFSGLLLGGGIAAAAVAVAPIGGPNGGPAVATAAAPIPQAAGQLVPSLAPMRARVTPGVVNIAVRGRMREQNPLLQDPFFRRYFGVPDAALQPAMAAGSGVIVDGKRGFVITNFHVVRNAQAVQVILKDGRKFPAQPIGFEPNLDLAVLQIGASDLPTLALGDSSKLEVGDYVVAIGNPFGLGQTVTSGIISATDRPLGQGDSRSFIQTDAPINPGNSGGALINLNGELIGINSALFSPSQSESGAGNVGIGFAIPSSVVKQVLAEAEKARPPQ